MIHETLGAETSIGVELRDLQRFVGQACSVAQLSLEAGYAAYGALVIDRTTNEIIAQAGNKVGKEAGAGDSLLHAEKLVLSAAARVMPDEELRHKGVLVVSTPQCRGCATYTSEKVLRVATGTQHPSYKGWLWEPDNSAYVQTIGGPYDHRRYMQSIVHGVLGDLAGRYNEKASIARQYEPGTADRLQAESSAAQLLTNLQDPNNWESDSDQGMLFATSDPIWSLIFAEPNLIYLGERWMGEYAQDVFDEVLASSEFEGDEYDFVMSGNGNRPSTEASMQLARAYMSINPEIYARWQKKVIAMNRMGKEHFVRSYFSKG